MRGEPAGAFLVALSARGKWWLSRLGAESRPRCWVARRECLDFRG